MTGRFETLLYTDCLPGQGLQRLAGLQFQARSGDQAALAEPLVQRHLLYEPPARWMAEQRAVELYPPSFAHVQADGFYATAAGVYLGREAAGGRWGNQLTHAIVTRDATDYGALRPAQLFGAAFWRTVPAPSTTSQPVTQQELAAAERDTRYPAAAARDLVRAAPDGTSMLVALVSALEKAGMPGHPRVLFVGADVAAIIAWLVAGTLLVPRRRAAELGFKIFSNDPARGGLPVVGVHPDFAGAAATLDNRLGYAVFDVARHRYTDVPASARARRWVELFLTENPIDVVDAVDVADLSGLEPEPAAAALGLAAILHREPERTHVEAIIRWLRTGPEQLRDAYAGDVAAMFARTPDAWTHAELLLLDAAGCDGLIPGKAGSVRLVLLEREIADATGPGAVQPGLLPALPAGEWTAGEAASAEHALLSALHGEVAAPHVDALLRVATRFGVDLPVTGLTSCAPAFVRYWADHPEARFDPRAWPCGDELDDLLLDELTARAAGGAGNRERVGALWWRDLLPRLDRLAPPLAMAALGAAVRFLPGADRATFARRQLTPSAHDLTGFTWMVAALWSQSPPTLTELSDVAALAPGGFVLPDGVDDRLVEQLTGDGPLQPQALKLALTLTQAGQLRQHPGVDAILSADRRLREAVEGLRDANPPAAQAHRWLAQLAALPQRLVKARAGQVVDALLATVAFSDLAQVLIHHPALIGRYCTRLAEAVEQGGPPGQAAVAYYLAGGASKNLPELRGALRTAHHHWVIRAPGRQLAEAGELVARLGADWSAAWQETVDQLASRRRTHGLLHPFGRG